jgi:riboflavin kinase/FMN adenylyltransferase
MALFRDIEAFREAAPRSVIAIGNFDGIHAGHRHVLAFALKLASETGVAAAVLTFDPHPVRFFKPTTPEFALTSLDERAILLGLLGIEHLVALNFDAGLSSKSPKEFVDEILVSGIDASQVLVGEGFRFGKGRAGDTTILTELCAARGVAVHVVGLAQIQGVVVSSTRIRDAVRDADFDVVRELLGRNFVVSGKVVHGDARGRDLGYPTANVQTEQRLLPPDGIYATWLYDAQSRHPSATYVGTRPTFDGSDRRVESFILNATGPVDLYEHDVVIEFVGRVRSDMRYESAEALVAQMAIDVEQSKQILGV